MSCSDNCSRFFIKRFQTFSANSGTLQDMSDEKQPRKASSLRHTRAIQRDQSKHPVAAPWVDLFELANA
jgi:hypothetical protein